MFEAALADAARREIDDAQQRAVIFLVGDQAQVSQCMLNFLALEKAQAAINPIRHAGGEQSMFDNPRLRVGAIEHGDVGQRRAFAAQAAHFVDDVRRFLEIGGGLEHPQRFALGVRRPQAFAEALAVVPDQRIGGVEDIAVRAVVLFELDDFLNMEIALQVLHVRRRRAAPAVNRLVVVADCEYRVVLPRQQLQPAVLQAIRVLKLVNEDVAETAGVVFTQMVVAREQLI